MMCLCITLKVLCRVKYIATSLKICNLFTEIGTLCGTGIINSGMMYGGVWDMKLYLKLAQDPFYGKHISNI